MLSYSTVVVTVFAAYSVYKHNLSGAPIDFSVFLLLIYVAPAISLFLDYQIKQAEPRSYRRRMLYNASTIFVGVDVGLLLTVVLLHFHLWYVHLASMAGALVLSTALTMAVELIDQKSAVGKSD